ncbi:hypothetical protein B296_00050992 [Ensete ventricosum]|uniref:Uncharacterized protein n=1 Tax=Ensete ventricosum TaxID=4639 RepID=A0A426XNE2_ENSVE|nr:hypothetical protein B296_00050992 [Ensete ventricosum]
MARPLARAATHGQVGCGQDSLQGGNWMLPGQPVGDPPRGQQSPASTISCSQPAGVTGCRAPTRGYSPRPALSQVVTAPCQGGCRQARAATAYVGAVT